MKIIVRDRQNIFDIAFQYFGNMSFASTIIRDNGLTWAASISSGDELIINNEGVGNASVKNFFLLKKGFVQNGALILINNDPPHTFDNTLITWDSTVVTWDQT